MDETRFELPITSLLDKCLAEYSDKEVIFDGYRRINYRILHQEANNLASGLTKLGIVKKGDRVAVNLPNWYEYIVIFLLLPELELCLYS